MPDAPPPSHYWSGVFSGIGAVAVATAAWWWVDVHRVAVPGQASFLAGVACTFAAGLLIGRATAPRPPHS